MVTFIWITTTTIDALARGGNAMGMGTVAIAGSTLYVAAIFITWALITRLASWMPHWTSVVIGFLVIILTTGPLAVLFVNSIVHLLLRAHRRTEPISELS